MKSASVDDRRPQDDRASGEVDPTVVVEACDRYDYRQLYRKVRACLAPLGGMEAFVRPGQTALLKVDLSGVGAPESAAVTHPNVVVAVARLVLDAGGRPIVADWPDDPAIFALAVERSGLRKAADIFGIEVRNLDGCGAVELPCPDGVTCKCLPVSAALREAEVLISLPRLKLHPSTGCAGAVQNLYGLLERDARQQLPCRDASQFAEALVDACAAIRPHLSLIDAVVSMEGDGPERGTPRHTGFIAASRSAPALDYAAASLAGVPPMSVPEVAASVRRGLLIEGKMQTAGCDLERLRQSARLPESPGRPPERADVLVTGGTGYIGRALVARLVAEGRRVVVPTRRNVPPPTSGSPVDYVQADVNDPTWMEKNAFALSGVRQVFHLAASLDYFGDEAALRAANVEATRHLLGWSLARGIDRFVFASSIEAAGTAPEADLPIPEDRPPAPVSPYGQSKAEAERCVLAAIQRGLKATAVRIGQVYGEGGMSFVLEILKSLIHGGDMVRYLPVYADQILHPVHIDDVVSGLIAASRGTGQDIYHLCGPEPATLGAIFEVIATAVGAPLAVPERTPADAEELMRHVEACRARRQADLIAYFAAGGLQAGHRAYTTDRIAQDFEFRPSVGIEEGIVRTIRWLKQTQTRAA